MNNKTLTMSIVVNKLLVSVVQLQCAIVSILMSLMLTLISYLLFTDCKVEILDGHANAGILEPHGYPQPYLGQQDCQWKIKGKPLHVLRLRFDKIDIEYSSCCRNDMLAIKTTSNNYLALVHNLPERICGYYDSLKFYWDGDFTMQFRTSARAVASRHAGFRLHYSYVPVEETSVQELLTRSVSGGYLNHTC